MTTSCRMDTKSAKGYKTCRRLVLAIPGWIFEGSCGHQEDMVHWKRWSPTALRYVAIYQMLCKGASSVLRGQGIIGVSQMRIMINTFNVNTSLSTLRKLRPTEEGLFTITRLGWLGYTEALAGKFKHLNILWCQPRICALDTGLLP